MIHKKRSRRTLAKKERDLNNLMRRLRRLARRISAAPYNASGSDKTWLFEAWKGWWRVMDSIERVDS